MLIHARYNDNTKIGLFSNQDIAIRSCELLTPLSGTKIPNLARARVRLEYREEFCLLHRYERSQGHVRWASFFRSQATPCPNLDDDGWLQSFGQLRTEVLRHCYRITALLQSFAGCLYFAFSTVAALMCPIINERNLKGVMTLEIFR